MWFEPPSLSFFFNLTPNNCPKIKGLTSTCEKYDISHKEDNEIPHDKACDKRPLVTHSIWLALVFTTIVNTLSPSQQNKIFSLIQKRYLGLLNIRLSELLEQICQFSGGVLSHLKQKKNHYEKWRQTNLTLFWLYTEWMSDHSTSSIAENFRKYSRKYDKKKLNVSQLVVNFKMWISNKESIFSTKVYQCDCKLLPHLKTPVARTLKTRAS